MRHITKENVEGITGFKWYKKKTLTKVARISGPFVVFTSEGEIICPDGYIAVDSRGWPYPIDKEEFKNIYEEEDIK